MVIDDIVFYASGSLVGNPIIITLPQIEGTNSPISIEAQTVFFEKKLVPPENKTIF